MQWPQLIQMRQQLDGAHIADLEACLREQLRARLADSEAMPGQTVAIGVGSRGVSPIVKVVRSIVSELDRAGLEPFIVPAMGSHGGATASGQEAVLAEYGITLDSVGAPVRATMDVVELGRGPSGQTFFGDANAYNADHVVVIGRVKPHTDFKGEIESGLCKMTSVGLGKQIGAERIHETGLAETIPEGAQVAIDYGRLLLGVALVENAYDQPAHCEVVAPDQFHATDRRLLIAAKRLLAAAADRPAPAPGRRRDGQEHLRGRDGHERRRALAAAEFRRKTARLPLPGNAPADRGVGRERHRDRYGRFRLRQAGGGDGPEPDLHQRHDLIGRFRVTDSNELSDRRAETLQVAVSAASRLANRGTPRMARIRNTMELEEFWASEPVADQLETDGRAERTGASEHFAFDDAGNLIGVAA